MITTNQDFFVTLSLGAGALCSAASTLSYAQGSWVGAFGTLAVSGITIAGSGLGTLELLDAVEENLSSTTRKFLNKNFMIPLVAMAITSIALNALALNAIIWTGLPIASLSFQATVLSGVAVIAPLVTLGIIDMVF